MTEAIFRLKRQHCVTYNTYMNRTYVSQQQSIHSFTAHLMTNIDVCCFNMYVNIYTVGTLSIQTLCELHRHVASLNDLIFSIRRLHSNHLDHAHAMASNLFTMLFCIPL